MDFYEAKKTSIMEDSELGSFQHAAVSVDSKPCAKVIIDGWIDPNR